MNTPPEVFARAFFAFALAFAPHARAQQQPAAPSSPRADAPPAADSRAKGSITVRVVGDDNQPVANAVVTSQQLGAGSRFNNDNSGATTGRYVLSNLDPGVYRVSVFAPGYVQETDPFSDPAERNLLRPGDTANIRLTKGGVITGRVTDAAGAPVVGAGLSVRRVRDAAGRVTSGASFEAFYYRWRTDDRGVYRVFGLPAGTYVVRAGGRSSQNFGTRPSAYDSDAPTYYPSATRDGAVELQVQTGQEMADIDIRHRGERGHAVSGTVTGTFTPGDFGPGGAGVVLRHLASGTSEGFSFVSGSGELRSFNFEGVADGDYDLVANSTATEKETGTASAPLRVAVRGADVTGLRLALAPLAAVSGWLAFEPPKQADAARPECQGARATVAQEIIVFAAQDASAGAPPSPFASSPERAPDERGEFTIRNLTPGRYRLGLRLVDDNLFARSITLGAAPAQPAGGAAATAGANARAAAAASDIARNGLGLGAGERLSGVTVAVAQGAASLRGRVASANEGETLTGNWRVHLVPAEPERAEDVLRYSEGMARADGTFHFRNLAPGRYHLLARPVTDAELRRPTPPRPAAWDAARRAELRREAEAAKNAVALQPCQRAEDFTLRANTK